MMLIVIKKERFRTSPYLIFFATQLALLTLIPFESLEQQSYKNYLVLRLIISLPADVPKGRLQGG